MTNNGWICPKCGAVYSPYIQQCFKCNGMAEQQMVMDAQPYEMEFGNTEDATIDYDALFSELQTYGAPQTNAPVPDPNTQCVDCFYAIPIQTPDGLAKTIKCRYYSSDQGDVLRNPQDTCLHDAVDLNTMIAKKERRES